MDKGDRVRIIGLVSDRGTIMDSIRDEFRQGTTGRIRSGPCEVGWYAVDFPTCQGGPLQVPRELLVRVRSWD